MRNKNLQAVKEEKDLGVIRQEIKILENKL